MTNRFSAIKKRFKDKWIGQGKWKNSNIVLPTLLLCLVLLIFTICVWQPWADN